MAFFFLFVFSLFAVLVLSRTSWGRTKTKVFFSTVLLPWVLEPMLVYWFKFLGPRKVYKHWKAQLARQPFSSGVTSAHSQQQSGVRNLKGASFRIQLATQREHHPLSANIATMVNRAYVRELKDALVGDDDEAEAAFARTSRLDIERRLLSDAELAGLRCCTRMINRVLFLAVTEEDDTIIGTCSATLAAPWTGVGVGSWGLLAVGTPRGGVGRRLVEHCEEYAASQRTDARTSNPTSLFSHLAFHVAGTSGWG